MRTAPLNLLFLLVKRTFFCIAAEYTCYNTQLIVARSNPNSKTKYPDSKYSTEYIWKNDQHTYEHSILTRQLTPPTIPSIFSLCSHWAVHQAHSLSSGIQLPAVQLDAGQPTLQSSTHLLKVNHQNRQPNYQSLKFDSRMMGHWWLMIFVASQLSKKLTNELTN